MLSLVRAWRESEDSKGRSLTSDADKWPTSKMSGMGLSTFTDLLRREELARVGYRVVRGKSYYFCAEEARIADVSMIGPGFLLVEGRERAEWGESGETFQRPILKSSRVTE